MEKPILPTDLRASRGRLAQAMMDGICLYVPVYTAFIGVLCLGFGTVRSGKLHVVWIAGSPRRNPLTPKLLETFASWREKASGSDQSSDRFTVLGTNFLIVKSGHCIVVVLFLL